MLFCLLGFLIGDTHVLFVYIYFYFCKSEWIGNILSMVSLKASSSIRDISIFSKGDDSSMHGLVLTSMSHTLRSLSIMKS